MNRLKKDNIKKTYISENGIGPISWHQHKSRLATRALFQPPTGHNRPSSTFQQTNIPIMYKL